MPDLQSGIWRRGFPCRLYVVFVLLIYFVISSCATVTLKPEKAVSREKVKEILQALRVREARIQRLKGLFRVAITGSILPISKTLPGVVFYAKPDSIRLKALTPVGGTFFQFIREGEDYRLQLPGRGQSTTGKIHELEQAGDIGHVVELSLRALNAVLGKVQGLIPDVVRVIEEEQQFRLDIPALDDQKADDEHVTLTRVWVDKSRLDIVHLDYLNPEGEVIRSIDCRDFRAVSVESSSIDGPIHLPFHIHAIDDRLSGSVTLDFQELVANVML